VSKNWIFFFSILIAIAWMTASIIFSLPWLSDLSNIFGTAFAIFAITFIAYIPGFTNFFMASSMVMAKRKVYPPLEQYPPISVLIAAYNEESTIRSTLVSILDARYKGSFEVIVVSDGSTDRTAEIVDRFSLHDKRVRIVDLKKNAGKAAALTEGLKHVTNDLVVTIDADTTFHRNALDKIVERYECDKDNVAAVAGAIIVKNIKESFITRLQAWDYFFGISAVKRTQGLYDGVLVAQGAFSLYRKDVLEECGGWQDTVGEDIVLSWSMLSKGYRILHAEEAIAETNAPATVRQFWKQRARWARGLVEALRAHGTELATKRRLSTLFIWWNFLFPVLDFVYTFIFIPGVLIAIFLHIYWIAGIYTLLVLPLALVINMVVNYRQYMTLRDQGIYLEGNKFGLVMYILFYGAIMIPSCVYGYVVEWFKMEKKWGTK